MAGGGAGVAKRLGTLLSGLLECGAFCGIIFGWASLVFVLKDLRYFEDLCEPAATPGPNWTLLPGTFPVPWPPPAAIPVPAVALAPLSPCLVSPTCLCPGVPAGRVHVVPVA